MVESVDPLFWLPGGTEGIVHKIFPEQKPPAPVTQTKQVQGGLGEDEATQAERERRRRRLVASILAKDWDQPVLGQPALLGLGG